MKIGILALQGDFNKHRLILEQLELEQSLVRYPSDLNHVGGLIIPGGESTTMTKLMTRSGFYEYITSFANTNPVLGTCAGLIMMSNQAKDKPKCRPDCTAHGEPLNVANTFTLGPHRTIFGARINVASISCDLPIISTFNGTQIECICLPEAFLSTSTSINPSVFIRLSFAWLDIIINPAQVPKTGFVLAKEVIYS